MFISCHYNLNDQFMELAERKQSIKIKIRLGNSRKIDLKYRNENYVHKI